jgi:site-specific recombinase XerD
MLDPLLVRGRALPKIGQAFIAMLSATMRPGTCSHYVSSLRRFHTWLENEHCSLASLKREHVEAWLTALNNDGLSPASRLHIIVDVRVYLRWLRGRGILHALPDDLVRRTDLPKLPGYLPRPLPPEVDLELQSRLAASQCRFQNALAIMRATGVRVGELRSLEFNCVRNDHRGNTFLKVPLGKMNTERLVPIDEPTCALIKSVRETGVKPRRYLLEDAGQKLGYHHFGPALRIACIGLDTAGRMTTHRLRHTYATALLNGGMSLVGLMRVLGHRDYRMTLRYAAITDERVGIEYFQALDRIKTKYQTEAHADAREEFDPSTTISDLIRWLKTNLSETDSQKRRAMRLVKRLDRIRHEVRSQTPARPRD